MMSTPRWCGESLATCGMWKPILPAVMPSKIVAPTAAIHVMAVRAEPLRARRAKTIATSTATNAAK